MKLMFLAARPWAQEVARQFNGDYITSPLDINNALWYNKPDIVFSLHWHWKIHPDLCNNFNIIGFHSADLPKFRGGSPIANQLKAGITRTKLTAFRVTEKFDAGNILLKRDLTLDSDPAIMYNRLRNIVPEMIQQIMDGNYVETPQDDTQATFHSRKDASTFQTFH